MPLDLCNVVHEGKDITIVSWGFALHKIRTLFLKKLSNKAEFDPEIIDLSSIYPIDYQTIFKSVKKTGSLIIVNEAPFTNNVASEIVSTVQEEMIESIKAPIVRVCGWDTPFPLVFEEFYLNLECKILDAIERIKTFY